MRDSGTRGSTEVKDLGAGLDVSVLNSSEDGGSELGAERVPDTVLGLGSVLKLFCFVLMTTKHANQMSGTVFFFLFLATKRRC